MTRSAVAAILAGDGLVARRLAGYESRPQQLRMAEAIGEAIAGPHHLMVEAGTGVGKSFGYLVPAILAASEVGKKVVISTHTISLQEQLLRKDLPFLRSVMPCEFTAVLVKGRWNYLSLRRLQAALKRGGLTLETEVAVSQLAALARWVRQTDEGSRSELTFRPLDEVWEAVASDFGNCLGKSCPTYRDCFYYQVARRARNAHLLVVNHALYMVDLALRREGVALLPDHAVAIFDEAHHLESAAAQQLGIRVHSGSVVNLLNQLYNERTGRGLLVYHRLTEAIAGVRAALDAADQFFDRLADWRRGPLGQNGRVRRPLGIPNLLGVALSRLASALKQGAESIAEPEQRIEVDAARLRCEGLAEDLEIWLEQQLPEGVYWVEVEERSTRRVQLAGVPLDLSQTLRQALFDRVPTCVMTSATLTVDRAHGFDFLKARLGVGPCRTLAVGSPFDYPNQVTLHLATDLPDPGREPEEFERLAVEAIRYYLGLTQGKAFVLFTSYRFLKAAESALATWLADRGITLLSQGSGAERSRLLDAFKADLNSVLFGVDSFWQGVDVPGEALSNVIITRLPFAVPEEPLTQARLEAIEARGGNAFAEYSVPEAILKLKQGFGRLIRSRSDRGIVAILDPRVLTKSYGQRFLDALPACPRRLDRLRERIAAPPPRARAPEAT